MSLLSFVVFVLLGFVSTINAETVILQENVKYENSTSRFKGYTIFFYTPNKTDTVAVGYSVTFPQIPTGISFSTNGYIPDTTAIDASQVFTYWRCPRINQSSTFLGSSINVAISNKGSVAVPYTITASELTLDQVSFNSTHPISMNYIKDIVFVLKVDPDQVSKGMTLVSNAVVSVTFGKCTEAPFSDYTMTFETLASTHTELTIDKDSFVPLQAGYWFFQIGIPYDDEVPLNLAVCFGDKCKPNLNPKTNNANILVASMSMMILVTFVLLNGM